MASSWRSSSSHGCPRNARGGDEGIPLPPGIADSALPGQGDATSHSSQVPGRPVPDVTRKKAKPRTYTCAICSATGARSPGAYVTATDTQGGRHDVCSTCAPRFYIPFVAVKEGHPDSTPGYKVAPKTDCAVVHLVKRHGVLYPIFLGFHAALLRLIYGVEGCVEPYRDDLLGQYPVREIDTGLSVYDGELLVPQPYSWSIRPPCWHPWFRSPPHKENVTRKVKDAEGNVTEKTEEIEVKGKLRLFVLHKGTVSIPALSLGADADKLKSPSE